MKLEAQCPKCGFKLPDNLATVNEDEEFVCRSCGHTGTVTEFLTPDSIRRINEAAKQAAIKALSGIKGFK